MQKKLLKNLQIQKNTLPLHRNQEIKVASSNNGALVQLVRIRACHARGQGFESPTHRKKDGQKQSFFLFFYHYQIRANVYCVAYELCIMGAMSKLKHHATYPNRFAIFARQYKVTLFHAEQGTRIYEGLSRYD